MQDAGWQRLVFPVDGEMVRRMRDYPWGRSPLGDPRDWPSGLRTACRVCLTSRFPMIVWWGPELRFLYNDAYRPLLGDKHPALDLPGRQVWSEIWDTIGPMLDSVMSTGQATWSEDLLLPMRRHGYWEETYWTYSYSPLHDDDGTVRGVFTAVTESTEQVVGRRRLAVLQDLGALAGRGRGVTEVCDLVVGTLSRARHDVPYAAIYLRGAGGDGDVAAGGALLAASSAAGPAPAWPVAEVLRSGQPAALANAADRFGRLPSGDWSGCTGARSASRAPSTRAPPSPCAFRSAIQTGTTGPPRRPRARHPAPAPRWRHRPIHTGKRRCAGCRRGAAARPARMAPPP